MKVVELAGKCLEGAVGPETGDEAVVRGWHDSVLEIAGCCEFVRKLAGWMRKRWWLF